MKRTITKEFSWDCAHRLYNPELDDDKNKEIFGNCFSVHGHLYRMFVTVSQKDNNLENGMIVNFKDLKKIVKEEIVDIMDHSLTLTDGDPLLVGLDKDMKMNLNIVSYITTCEHQIADFWNKIKVRFHGTDIQLEEIKLYETPTSFATLSR